jgi:hypothetical protein
MQPSPGPLFMTKINVTYSLAMSHIDGMEDDVVDNVDDHVNVSADMANDVAADMVMMWIVVMTWLSHGCRRG